MDGTFYKVFLFCRKFQVMENSGFHPKLSKQKVNIKEDKNNGEHEAVAIKLK